MAGMTLGEASALVHKAEQHKAHAVKLIERCERSVASQAPQQLLRYALQVDQVIQEFGHTSQQAEKALVQLKKERPAGVTDAQLRRLREQVKALHDNLADMKGRLVQVQRERMRIQQEEQQQQDADTQDATVAGMSTKTVPAGLQQEQWQDTRRKMVEERARIVQQREQGVEQLHQDMSDIHGILQNMAEDITVQGQQLAGIENSMQTTYERVEDGMYNLEEANALLRNKSYSRPKKEPEVDPVTGQPQQTWGQWLTSWFWRS